MNKDKAIEVLSFELKDIRQSELVDALYSEYNGDNEVPYSIETFCAIVDYDSSKGATFGELFVYKLPEANIYLFQAYLGWPGTRPQFKPLYSEGSSYISRDIKLQNPDADYLDDSQDENGFQWNCYLIKAEKMEALHCSCFYQIVYDANMVIQNIYKKQHCIALGDRLEMCMSYKLSDEDDESERLSLSMKPLGAFIDDYKQYICLEMLPRELLYEILGPSSAGEGFVGYLNRTLPSFNAEESEQLLQAFTKRFCKENRIEQSYGYANEIYINFQCIDEEAYDGYAKIRNNKVYCNRYLYEDAQSREAMLRIGTFLVHTRDKVRCSTVQEESYAIITLSSGEMHYIGVNKCVQPFTQNNNFSVAQLKYYYQVNFFTFIAADSPASKEVASFNHRKMNQHNILRPFYFIEQVYSRSASSGSIKFELFRPLFCTFYGGTSYNIQVQPQQKYLFVEVPRYRRMKMPQSKFPLHRSETIALPIYRTSVWAERGQFLRPQLLCERREEQQKEILFYLENLNFVSYKMFERLVNSLFIFEFLPSMILSMVLDPLGNSLCGGRFKNALCYVSCCREIHSTSADHFRVQPRDTTVPTLGSQSHIVELNLMSAALSRDFSYEVTRVDLAGNTHVKLFYAGGEYLPCGFEAVNLDRFIANTTGFVHTQLHSPISPINFYMIAFHDFVGNLDLFEQNAERREQLEQILGMFSGDATTYCRRILNEYDEAQLNAILDALGIDRANSVRGAFGIKVHIK